MDLAGRHLVLVGLMGSGKTTVGRRLAAHLDRPFVDSDETIEGLTGRTVRRIRAESGVEVMRRHEADALFDALDGPTPTVIAAAAGVVIDPHDRRRLAEADAAVVWLDGSPSLLAERAVGGAHRPFLDDDPVGTLRTMHDERADLYRMVADHVVHVDDLTADEVVARVVS